MGAERTQRRWYAASGAELVRSVPGALLTCVVLISGTTLTWLAWRATIHSEEQRVRNELALRAADIDAAIEDRLLAYEGMLYAGAGVMNAFWPVSAEQWRVFVRELRPATVYPGVQGLGFAAQLREPADLEKWSRSLEPLGIERIEPWPVIEGRAPQSAIVLLEPLDERNRRAIGYDMTSESTRRRAMERARDTGGAALSGKVTLVQEMEQERSVGFLMYLPVFSTATAPAALGERRRSLRGYVYSPFRAADFFRSALAAVPEDTKLEVFDGDSTDSDALLYRSAPALAADAMTDARQIKLAGHVWTLRVSPLPGQFAMSVAWPALLIAISGAAITLLLAAIVSTLALSRQRLRERIEADTALALRERKASEVLANALDAYISIDTSDTVLEWNRQAEALFGWTTREMIGRKLVDTIVPMELRQRHFQAINTFNERAEHPLLGRRLQMPAVRKDGTGLLVELSIVQISSPEGVSLAASLRDITQQHQQQAQIRALNETLEERVLERTAQLEIANRDLEAFTYSVSHDLRAPLRAIDGHTTRFLEVSQALSDSQRRHAGAIRRNIARMNQLIDDLLNFAFISRRPLQKQNVKLWELVSPIVRELQMPQAVIFEIDPDALGEVHADPALLRQALTNLISNAVKFSRRALQPRIVIAREMRPEGSVYFVRDNGVGFDAQYAEKLFGVFERLHASTEFEGTGVGLAIVKQIIERHGGRVWAESQLGQGATFYFTLG